MNNSICVSLCRSFIVLFESLEKCAKECSEKKRKSLRKRLEKFEKSRYMDAFRKILKDIGVEEEQYDKNTVDKYTKNSERKENLQYKNNRNQKRMKSIEKSLSLSAGKKYLYVKKKLKKSGNGLGRIDTTPKSIKFD